MGALMCSRHAEPGAGEEYTGPYDQSCDYCGRTIYEPLRQVKAGRSISWLCNACHERHMRQYDEMVGAT